MEFDENRVFSSANADKVKVGSIGFFSDTLNCLKSYVKCDRFRHVLTKVNSESCQYRFCPEKQTNAYALFYLVEEPEEGALCTYRELAKWLMYGLGEYLYLDSSVVSTHFDYKVGKDYDIVKPTDYKVRKWGDDEWHKPTKKYMGIEDGF